MNAKLKWLSSSSKTRKKTPCASRSQQTRKVAKTPPISANESRKRKSDSDYKRKLKRNLNARRKNGSMKRIDLLKRRLSSKERKKRIWTDRDLNSKHKLKNSSVRKKNSKRSVSRLKCRPKRERPTKKVNEFDLRRLLKRRNAFVSRLQRLRKRQDSLLRKKRKGYVLNQSVLELKTMKKPLN